ncbi:MAG: hypothetical protein HYV40_04775 [Candidatus Levybacteria bacterium]|nr:hypothetical protein [Candidatus Levybacteria bacterium]
MYNWSTDTTQLKKNPEQYTVWRLEQMINFGLDGKKLSTRLIKKYWDKIHIDTKKRDALAFLLWGKRS